MNSIKFSNALDNFLFNKFQYKLGRVEIMFHLLTIRCICDLFRWLTTHNRQKNNQHHLKFKNEKINKSKLIH